MDDGRVIRIAPPGKAQLLHEHQHAGVLGQHRAFHGLQALVAGSVQQRLHQPRADAQALEIVADHDGEFAAFAIRIDHVAGNAALLGLAILAGKGDQLYCVAEDPGENNNLIASKGRLAKQMLADLTASRKELLARAAALSRPQLVDMKERFMLKRAIKATGYVR